MPPVPLPRVVIGALKAANTLATTFRRVQTWHSSFILVSPRKWFINSRRMVRRMLRRPRKVKRLTRRYIRFPKKKRQKRRTLLRGRNQAKKRPRLSWRVQTMLIRDPELRQYLFDRFTTQRTLMASHFSGQPEAYATHPEFHPLVSGRMQVFSKRLFQFATRGPVSFFMPIGAPPTQSKADPFHELYQLKLQMGLTKPLDEPPKTAVETERDKEKALIEKITKQIPLKGSTRLMKSLSSVYLGIDWESKMIHGHYLFKQDTLANYSYMKLAKYNRMFEGFSHAEAYTYLNIKEPMMQKLDPLWLLIKAKHLFLVNNPAKGGSKYLQAKVIYALLFLMHWNAQIDSSVDFTDPLTKWSNEELAKNNPEKRLAALADMTSDYKEASRQLDAGEIKLEDYNDFIFAPPSIRTHPLWEQVDKTFGDLASEIRDIEPELHEIQREIERRRPDLQKEREKWTFSGAIKSRSKKKYRPRMRKVGPPPTPVAGKEPQKPTLPKPSGALLTYVMEGVTEAKPKQKVYGTGSTYDLEIQQAREEESKRGKGRK